MSAIDEGMKIYTKEEAELIKEYNQVILKQEIYISGKLKEIMKDLPDRLQDFYLYFRSLPIVEIKKRVWLYDEYEEVIKACMPYSGDLLIYGMTPMTIFFSVEALLLMFDRFLLYSPIKDIIINRRKKIFCDSLFHKAAMNEIALMALADNSIIDADVRTAQLIFSWMVEVLQFKPFLFNNFRAEFTDSKINLISDPTIKGHFREQNPE